jgi:hypothetical protein
MFNKEVYSVLCAFTELEKYTDEVHLFLNLFFTVCNISLSWSYRLKYFFSNFIGKRKK